MAIHESSRGFLLSLILLTAFVPAQASSDDRHEVVVIGASVSAGYMDMDMTVDRADGVSNRTVRLDLPLKKVWDRELARVRNFSSMMMFQDPDRLGQQQIDMAKKVSADVVVAVDYLFWFCYGGSPRGRMEKLERGLKTLEALECPMVVGDIPDMHGAEARILRPSMIPDVDTLAAMNARVRAWVKKREGVVLFPLAAFASDIKKGKQVVQYDEKKTLLLPKNFTLQSDLLHTTRFGVTILAHRVVEALPTILGPRHALVPSDFTLKKLIEALGIEEDLPPDKAPVPVPVPQ